MNADQKLDRILEKLDKIEKNLEGVDLQSMAKKVESHDRVINALEKKVRKKNLIFFGIPEGGEPLPTILEIVNSLEGVTCSDSDIEACYRRGDRSKLLPDRSRPIIVEFLTVKMKERIYAARRQVEKPAYVRLDLPPKYDEAAGSSQSSDGPRKRKDTTPIRNTPKKPTPKND